MFKASPKKFNGLLYKVHGTHFKYPIAKDAAKDLRDNGFLVRIVKQNFKTSTSGKKKMAIRFVIYYRRK